MRALFGLLSDGKFKRFVYPISKPALLLPTNAFRRLVTSIGHVGKTATPNSSEPAATPVMKLSSCGKLHWGSTNAAKSVSQFNSLSRHSSLQDIWVQKSYSHNSNSLWLKWKRSFSSNVLLMPTIKNDAIKFDIGGSSKQDNTCHKGKKTSKRAKMSRKEKVNELRFYRLKAKKKMKSPNPEVRIRYKLGKAKRKEEWLIEKLRKFESPKTPEQIYDPEILTKEERFYLKRTGERKKHYVLVGRRGVFGGVVLNMHLHWKRHETVKVSCKPCRPGQVYEYAQELTRLSKGIVIDIDSNNTIIFYRGKNYAQPKVMSPPETLSKMKALEKYKLEQSLEHTSGFIEKLEKELEDYHTHLARFKKLNEEVIDKKTCTL